MKEVLNTRAGAHSEVQPTLIPAAVIGQGSSFMAGAVLGLLVAGVSAAYWYLFSMFKSYDDEGTLMLTVRHMLAGHPIYDQVRTYYGPIYYLQRDLLFGVLHFPLTNDATRMVSLITWCSAAALIALSIGQLRSGRPIRMSLAAASWILALHHLQAICNEPGHPQELVAFFVAFALFAAAAYWRSNRRLTLTALGSVCACTLLIKVNVGIFFCGSVLLAIAPLLKTDSIVLKSLIRLGCICALSLPLLLLVIFRPTDVSWIYFSTLLESGIIAVFISSLRTPAQRTAARSCIVPMVVSFSAVVLLAILFCLAQGNSLAGTLSCMISSPLQTFRGTHVGLAPETGVFAAVWAISGCILSVALAKLGARLRLAFVIGFSALTFSLVVIGEYGHQSMLCLYSVPYAWLLLGRRSELDGDCLVRRLLATTCCLLPLMSFVYCGSQFLIGTVTIVPACAILLGDAILELKSISRRGPTSGTINNALVAVILVLASGFALLKWRTFHANVPSHLRGFGMCRLPERQAIAYRTLTQSVQSLGGSFISRRGLNSMYFWTGCEPPTTTTLTECWTFITREQDEELLRVCSSSANLLYIDAPAVALFDENLDQLAFLRFIKNHYRQVGRVEDYLLLTKSGREIPVASRL